MVTLSGAPAARHEAPQAVHRLIVRRPDDRTLHVVDRHHSAQPIAAKQHAVGSDRFPTDVRLDHGALGRAAQGLREMTGRCAVVHGQLDQVVIVLPVDAAVADVPPHRVPGAVHHDAGEGGAHPATVWTVGHLVEEGRMCSLEG